MITATTLLTSTGEAGKIEQRSAGRTYHTSDRRITDPNEFLSIMNEVSLSADTYNSRRWVFRTRCSPEVVQEIEERGIKPSVKLPFSALGLGNDSLVSVEHNIHTSDVPEWNEVYRYWKQEKKYPEPADEVTRLPSGFSLTRNFTFQDRETLYELWKPFGWTREKINSFIETYGEQNNIWISGVRDKNKQLASACMGEALVFDGVYMVEATEFGTRTDLRGHNLCTAAVVGLNAQIIQRSLYEEDTIPLLIAEFNMSSRSDVVGRKARMTIPEVEGVEGYREPHQVLRKNVAVLDGIAPNDLSFGSLPDEDKVRYRNSFKDPYRYWRNFIVGMMTRKNIDNYYSPAQVRQILDRFIN